MSKIKLSKIYIQNTCKLALNEDLFPFGDITTDIINTEVVNTEKIISNDIGIVGGLEFVKHTFKLIDKKIKISEIKRDGSRIKKGDVIAIVKGNIKNISYLDYLEDYLKPYFMAAVGNYKITMDAKKEFLSSNLNINKISDLMNSHHNYLKKDLKITTPEIDNMIDISFENGAIGSKIVGSGGGGSIVSLSTNSNTSNKIVSKLRSIGVKDAFIARKGSGPSIYYE